MQDGSPLARQAGLPSRLHLLKRYCVLEGISEEDQNNFLLLVDVSHWPVVANF